VWQWLHHGAHLEDGRRVALSLVDDLLEDELRLVRDEIGAPAFDQAPFAAARALFRSLLIEPVLPEWLTVPAYKRLKEMDR
jgi:malate synthase